MVHYVGFPPCLSCIRSTQATDVNFEKWLQGLPPYMSQNSKWSVAGRYHLRHFGGPIPEPQQSADRQNELVKVVSSKGVENCFGDFRPNGGLY